MAEFGLLPDKPPRASVTGILTEVDSVLRTRATLDWRFLSGLAHGRPWATSIWLDAHEKRANGTEPGYGHVVAEGYGLLRLPLTLARPYLEIADPRRRFPGQTKLEIERLSRLSD
jgi:hypothetical protein